MAAAPRQRFLAELRRRKVFRVAGAYLVGAWVVLQVGDVVVEPLRLPEWTMSFLIVVVALGFPLAIALAWIFDLTPQGVTRTEPTAAGAEPAPAAPASRAFGLVGVGFLIAFVAFGGYAYFGQAADRDPTAISSVAVLPFVNMSDDPDNEYFSDGITEQLLDALAGVDGLRVPARTSSFQFKGENLDVRDVGRKLNVQAVLEGSVRRANDQVRITTQLIDAATGYHIWSQTYDRELSDIFAVQDEIAHAIVDALRLTLAGADDDGARPAATTSIEAHDRYLLGRHHFLQRGAASLRQAERHFQAAIEIDPDYAEAHAGLALTYAVLPLFDPIGTPVEQAVRNGREAAQKALALDPSQADAHAAIGQIAQNYEWDWDTAERHYGRAVTLAPNDPVVRQWHTEVLVVRGKPEAAAEMEKAAALDPLSPIANSVAALTHTLISRDFERAAHFWKRVDEIDPTFPLLAEYGALTFVAKGDGDRARELLLRLAPTAADSQAFAGLIDVATGTATASAARTEALHAADRYAAVSSGGEAGAALFVGLFDPDRALDRLRPLINDPRYRHPMSWVGRFWFFDRMHDDPRYREITTALGL